MFVPDNINAVSYTKILNRPPFLLTKKSGIFDYSNRLHWTNQWLTKTYLPTAATLAFSSRMLPDNTVVTGYICTMAEKPKLLKTFPSNVDHMRSNKA